MRYALTIVLLAAPLPVALAQDNEAEKLFREMEKKIRDANAVQVAVDIELRAIKGREEDSKLKDKVSRANGFLLLTKDNKARLKISGEYVGMEMVSNGKQMKLATDEREVRSIGEAKAAPAPKNFHGVLSILVNRAGVTASSMMMPFLLKYGGREIDIEAGDRNRSEAWDFKTGAAEKVGGREAKVISYVFGPKDEKGAERFTLWLDANTLLPVKRVIVLKSENLHITEIYAEFKLDPKIDAKAFELISAPVNEAERLFRAMEEKIRAAKAVQFTFDLEMPGGKGEEGKLKGSLLFTKDNKARLKMGRKGKPETIEMISDGKRMKMAVRPETIAKVEEEPTPANLHSLVSTVVSGQSLLLIDHLARPPIFRVAYFRLGATEKVGGRDAKVVTYNAMGDRGQVTLWIDAETMLPLKRLIVFTEGRITEICNVSLNPTVDAGAFVLPK